MFILFLLKKTTHTFRMLLSYLSFQLAWAPFSRFILFFFKLLTFLLVSNCFF